MRVLGVILLVGGILLGYLGFQKYNENKANIKIGDLELTAKDKNNTTVAWFMIGAGVVAVIGGVALLARKVQ